jgi:hypothetical protein
MGVGPVSGSDLQRSIDRARSFRFAAVCGVAVDAFLIVANLARGPASALVPSVALVALLALIVLLTRQVRTLQRAQELNRHAGRLELAAKVAGIAFSSCPHFAAEPVDLLLTGERVAWVCPDCNAELPAGWAPGARAERKAPRSAKPHRGGVWSTSGSGRCTCPACQQSMREARGRESAAVAAEHFAQLARVGRESCISYCPICAARQASLPAELSETTIAAMEPGRPYYAVPWAMRSDDGGRMWLNPRYTAHDRPGGTASMRMELREDGYHVWPVPGEAYKPGTVNPQELVPVARLRGKL